MHDDLIYRLGDGRLWDPRQARYIAAEEASGRILNLRSAEGDDTEAYLIRTLEFYDLPLGELAAQSPKAIKARLAALDAQYLTPRTLAGLAANDPVAQSRWLEHEAKAEPLREALAKDGH